MCLVSGTILIILRPRGAIYICLSATIRLVQTTAVMVPGILPNLLGSLSMGRTYTETTAAMSITCRVQMTRRYLHHANHPCMQPACCRCYAGLFASPPPRQTGSSSDWAHAIKLGCHSIIFICRHCICLCFGSLLACWAVGPDRLQILQPAPVLLS